MRVLHGLVALSCPICSARVRFSRDAKGQNKWDAGENAANISVRISLFDDYLVTAV